MNALTELEDLKPRVQQKINELNRIYTYQSTSLEQSAVKNQNLTFYGVTKVLLVLLNSAHEVLLQFPFDCFFIIL